MKDKYRKVFSGLFAGGCLLPFYPVRAALAALLVIAIVLVPFSLIIGAWLLAWKGLGDERASQP